MQGLGGLLGTSGIKRGDTGKIVVQGLDEEI